MNSENKYLLLISVGPKIAERRPKTKPSRPAAARSQPLCRIASLRRRASSEQQRSKVGFPIRKFTDQSLFAAPHDLSQRTTSFVASQRQGIHQIPLRHLIALIAKARVFVFVDRSAIDRQRASWREKTSFASNASGNLSGQAPNPRLVARKARMTARRLFGLGVLTDLPAARLAPSGLRPNALPLHDVRDRGPEGTAPDRNPVRRPFGLRHAKRSRA